ncbi:glutathione S-transferase N-terminal domain-containing protein [Thiothrix litoralis]|uniref:Glutathione S-transferase N-terminal domain-containing protein n=1 Tax=Thiothrix litoralis TaxID=2891210 RepID=A0ABX7WMB4_9GAMM|nr:glutathione S-transferase N-terminal domain-containing protein [Thiothrix litoralis]QTR44816.1 glutathione S-transferase N-terminal domain-containing protein [Thiothrix litoralis]
MSQRKLYNYPLSGNAYKVRLLLALLGLDYALVNIDLKAGENLTPEFKQLNPRAQIPVLADGDTVIWDSMAILVYLARRYSNGEWLPTDVAAEARVMQWLALSENELLYGLARARAVLVLKRPFNLEQCQAEGKAGLAVLEQQLAGSDWLASDRPTIADIACYPYVMLAPAGEISLEDYPHVQQWLARVEALPGWVPMTA